jgi:hypothetical protein
MSVFSDALTTDLITTFLSLDEFGESHQINDTPDVTCILDDKNEPLKKGFVRYEGMGKSTSALFIRKNDISGSVTDRTLISVDKKSYHIVDSALDAGLYELTLEAVN